MQPTPRAKKNANTYMTICPSSSGAVLVAVHTLYTFSSHSATYEQPIFVSDQPSMLAGYCWTILAHSIVGYRPDII